MRLTRKTVAALGISGALTVMAGVSASAAVLGLPILGFGESASESAVPKVVHRTVYDDHYVTATTAPKPSTAAAGTASAHGGSGGPATTAASAPTAAPEFHAASTPAPQSTSSPAAPTATAPATPAVTEPPATQAPPVTSGRPPVPTGCREPEWDSEHQVWQCSNSVGNDD